MNAKDYGFEIERTLRLLCSLFTVGSDKNKPTLFHSIRVGTSLHSWGYSYDIVLAGYLHDVIEDTDMSELDVAKLYTPHIASLVAANSKDMMIRDPVERRRELIVRTVAHTESAAIVKAADILDNYAYYCDINDQQGKEYCIFNTRTMLDCLPSHYNDRIFAKLHSSVIVHQHLLQGN